MTAPEPAARLGEQPDSVAAVAVEPLRLAFFLADLMGGGAERMVVALANSLSRRVSAIDLVVANAAGPYVSELDPQVGLVDLGRKRVTGALPGLVRYLRERRPDVLMSTLSHANLVAVAAKRLAGVPTRVVVREASTPSVERHGLAHPKAVAARMFMNGAYRLADGIVAVSAGVADSVSELTGIHKDEIATLYNPVVTPELSELAQAPVAHRFFDPKVAPVVVNVGSLREVKDHATLIRAFHRVVAELDARLLILGEGPERPRLEGLMSELGLEERVDLAGFDPNPFAYLAKADLYALSSEREGLPGALIQALACGLPAVSTDCRSGPAEVLEGGRLGELVPVGDHEALAGAMLRTLRAPPDRAALVASSDKYRSERVIAGYLDYFSRLAGAPTANTRQAG